MGSDIYMLSQQIAIMSHGDLVATLQRVRDQLADDDNPKWAALIADIDRALNNARIA